MSIYANVHHHSIVVNSNWVFMTSWSSVFCSCIVVIRLFFIHSIYLGFGGGARGPHPNFVPNQQGKRGHGRGYPWVGRVALITRKDKQLWGMQPSGCCLAEDKFFGRAFEHSTLSGGSWSQCSK